MKTPFGSFVLILALAMAACGGGRDQAAPPTTAPGAAAASGNIGVPECDSYMRKYRACVDRNVPENLRATYNQGFEQTAASWRQAAATAEGRAGLASACQQAESIAKQSFQAYNCTW